MPIFSTRPMSISINPVTIMSFKYPNLEVAKHLYSGLEMTSLMPLTPLRRLICLLCGSGHSTSVVCKVTTPLFTEISRSPGSLRNNGFAETAARTLTSVTSSGIVLVLRWLKASRINFTHRRRSSRLDHAAEATAANQIGRIRRAMGRGIIKRAIPNCASCQTCNGAFPPPSWSSYHLCGDAIRPDLRRSDDQCEPD